MQPKRYHFIEHEILRMTLQHWEDSYPTDLQALSAFFRKPLQDITNRQLRDTLERLRPEYVTLWKYVDGRFREYPTEITDDVEFFYRGGPIHLRRTPKTDPYFQELDALFERPESEPEIPKKSYGF